MIRKLKDGKHRPYLRKKDENTGKRRNLGTFETREAAEKHGREVQYYLAQRRCTIGYAAPERQLKIHPESVIPCAANGSEVPMPVIHQPRGRPSIKDLPMSWQNLRLGLTGRAGNRRKMSTKSRLG
jgi:hypothetical protein